MLSKLLRQLIWTLCRVSFFFEISRTNPFVHVSVARDTQKIGVRLVRARNAVRSAHAAAQDTHSSARRFRSEKKGDARSMRYLQRQRFVWREIVFLEHIPSSEKAWRATTLTHQVPDVSHDVGSQMLTFCSPLPTVRHDIVAERRAFQSLPSTVACDTFLYYKTSSGSCREQLEST